VICKGDYVIFEMVEGRDIQPAARAALLHDPDGREWPDNVFLIGSFRKGPRCDNDEVPSDARRYLGRRYEIHCGSVTFPPRAGPWKSLGEVKELYYVRSGTIHKGMRHRFNKWDWRSFGARLLKGRGHAYLARHGSWYCLKLSKGAIANHLGLIWP
jgi:hypothetical protein